jgi:L-threonylcarbamoyladenylate synthase
MGTPTDLPRDLQQAIAAAAEVLRKGGLVVFPTDTVYGVGALAWDPAAVQRIYVVKERPADKPLQVMLARVEEIESVAEMTPVARALAERFLPGGLTLVLRRRPNVPDAITAGGETVAVRVPDHPIVRALVEALGAPLAATSANRSGEPAPVDAEGARAQLGDRVEFVLDGGRCPQAQESTIVDATVSPPQVLREGAVPRAALEAFLGQPLEVALRSA